MNAAQCRTARAALNLSVLELAEKAKVSPSTIRRLETSAGDLRESTVNAIRATLEAAGVDFMNGDEPGAKQRRRGPPSAMSA